MTYTEIKEICRKEGKTGLIPNWKGYLKHDWNTDTL